LRDVWSGSYFISLSVSFVSMRPCLSTLIFLFQLIALGMTSSSVKLARMTSSTFVSEIEVKIDYINSCATGSFSYRYFDTIANFMCSISVNDCIHKFNGLFTFPWSISLEKS